MSGKDNHSVSHAVVLCDNGTCCAKTKSCVSPRWVRLAVKSAITLRALVSPSHLSGEFYQGHVMYCFSCHNISQKYVLVLSTTIQAQGTIQSDVMVLMLMDMYYSISMKILHFLWEHVNTQTVLGQILLMGIESSVIIQTFTMFSCGNLLCVSGTKFIEKEMRLWRVKSNFPAETEINKWIEKRHEYTHVKSTILYFLES